MDTTEETQSVEIDDDMPSTKLSDRDKDFLSIFGGRLEAIKLGMKQKPVIDDRIGGQKR